MCDEEDELPSKMICSQCVREDFLSSKISSSETMTFCHYCGEVELCWSIEDLADEVDQAIQDHFVRTPDQPDSFQQHLQADREIRYVWLRDGYPILDLIENEALIPSSAASDVQSILQEKYADSELEAMGEECDYSEDSYYVEAAYTDEGWQDEWRFFEHSLKTEARFFSKTAASHLGSLFGRIDQLKTTSGRSLVVKAGPKRRLNHIYRARVFQNEEKLEEALAYPDIHLGPPPMQLATSGRMNARGISVFYGATAERTAIAEVRPPVGSKVVVADFKIIRELRLLDLTALATVRDYGSIFDSTLKGRLEKVAFLNTLGHRMARPVLPDDEALDYLATQVIADFLATENDPLFDGIIFQSAQVKQGRNILLFHKAALVEKFALPEGATVEARKPYETEDGPEGDYNVYEWIPLVTATKDSDGFSIAEMLMDHVSETEVWDGREVTLCVDKETINVHEINWTSHYSTRYGVRRYQHIKTAAPEFQSGLHFDKL